MPPIRKFCKEDIINTAYEIVKSEGLSSLNARRIAKELGCSIQPIFHNFSTMNELNKEIYNKIYNTYREYMDGAIDCDKPYKAMGLAYIKFASDYPEFFKIIFMQQTNLNAEKFVMADTVSEDAIKAGMLLSGLSYEEQKQLHIYSWTCLFGSY